MTPSFDEVRDFVGCDIELVGAGAWSTCFGFEKDGEELVIRFGNHLEDFEKDRVAASFDRPHLPVPRVLDVGAAFGAWYAVSSRARGTFLEEGSAHDWVVVLPSLFAALDAVRSIDLAHTSGYGGWGSDRNAPFASWREFLTAVGEDRPDDRVQGRALLAQVPRIEAVFDKGLSLLGGMADACPGRWVTHADLINRNVLVSGDRLTAVFDWGCGQYGDFLYDVAWIDFWSPWHPGLAAIDFIGRAKQHLRASGADVTDLDVRLRCCAIHIGVAHLRYNAFTGAAHEQPRLLQRLASYLD